ncbi:hypothetical protein ACO0QE_001292 [Hanseniaspora vineae]
MSTQQSNFGRRTWDRDEYLQLKKSNQLQSSHANKLTTLTTDNKQLYDKLYQKYGTQNYETLLSTQLKDVNKLMLKSSNDEGFTARRGKKFGFYCELCDFTFNNNMQFVDHLNEKQHFDNFEKIFGEEYVRDKRDNDDIPLSEFNKTVSSLLKQYQKELKSESKKNLSSKNASSSTGASIQVTKPPNEDNLKKTKPKKNKKKQKKQTNAAKDDIAKIMGFKAFK